MNISFLTRTTMALTLTSVLAVTSGCATIDNASQKFGSAVGMKNSDASAGVVAGAAGCAGGALVSRYVLHSSALAGCAIGGVVGAAGGVANHRHQVAAARAFVSEADQVKGVTATVAVKQVTAKDETTGKPTQTDALDKLNIGLPAGGVAQHQSDVSRILAKAAILADGSSEPTTIEIHGMPVQREWIDAQIRNSLKPGSTVKLVDVDAPEPRLVISPLPTVAGAK